MSHEFPSGPVPLNSELYIERSNIEPQAFEEVVKPGSLIRIKASMKMGKKSLLIRIIDYAKEHLYYKIVDLDFQEAGEINLSDPNKFLRWFCKRIANQLQILPNLDEYWDEDVGPILSCTTYFEEYLLDLINEPIVLAINQLHIIFSYDKTAQSFLPLLRCLHEKARIYENFAKLRIVVTYSTNDYVNLSVNQSPLNLGLPLSLPEFTKKEVEDLVDRHGLEWADEDKAIRLTERLMELVGGHPYLIRLALYRLVESSESLTQEQILEKFDQLLENAPTQSGIYSDHLRYLFNQLEEKSELKNAFREVLIHSKVQLKPIIAYKLESLGIIKLEGNYSKIACELHRIYFVNQYLRDNYLEKSHDESD